MHAGFQVQFPAIILRSFGKRAGDFQIPQGQIVLGIVGGKMLLHQALGLVKFAFVHQLPGLFQRLGAAGNSGLMGRTGPEGIFVQGKSLVFRVSEHHRADSAVADGQRFRPEVGGFFVP